MWEAISIWQSLGNSQVRYVTFYKVTEGYVMWYDPVYIIFTLEVLNCLPLNCLWPFEMGSHCVVQSALQLSIPLPMSPEFWELQASP